MSVLSLNNRQLHLLNIVFWRLAGNLQKKIIAKSLKGELWKQSAYNDSKYFKKHIKVTVKAWIFKHRPHTNTSNNVSIVSVCPSPGLGHIIGIDWDLNTWLGPKYRSHHLFVTLTKEKVPHMFNRQTLHLLKKTADKTLPLLTKRAKLLLTLQHHLSESCSH